MSGGVRFCPGCVRRTRRLRCGGCGRPTITLRRRVEWEVLCHLAELKPNEYQTTAGLWTVAGNGISRQEFGHIMRGLARRGLAYMEGRWDGPRYHRVPGALVEYHLGMNTFGDPSHKTVSKNLVEFGVVKKCLS